MQNYVINPPPLFPPPFNVEVGVTHTQLFKSIFNIERGGGWGGGVVDKINVFKCSSVPTLLTRIVEALLGVLGIKYIYPKYFGYKVLLNTDFWV